MGQRCWREPPHGTSFLSLRDAKPAAFPTIIRRRERSAREPPARDRLPVPRGPVAQSVRRCRSGELAMLVQGQRLTAVQRPRIGRDRGGDVVTAGADRRDRSGGRGKARRTQSRGRLRLISRAEREGWLGSLQHRDLSGARLVGHRHGRVRPVGCAAVRRTVIDAGDDDALVDSGSGDSRTYGAPQPLDRRPGLSPSADRDGRQERSAERRRCLLERQPGSLSALSEWCTVAAAEPQLALDLAHPRSVRGVDGQRGQSVPLDQGPFARLTQVLPRHQHRSPRLGW